MEQPQQDNNLPKKRIGIYSGSFNPIHLGHQKLAEYLIDNQLVDEVWFVVSPCNPLKKKEELIDEYLRLDMLMLAIHKREHFKASDIEFKLAVPSYTIDTLTYLNEKYPKHEFCLIMGEDNLYTLHKWKNVAELTKKYPIYYYPRPGCVRPDSPLLNHILSTADIHFVEAPLMEISGTFIRNGIKLGKDMSYFLPPAVWKYIKEMHFYEK